MPLWENKMSTWDYDSENNLDGCLVLVVAPSDILGCSITLRVVSFYKYPRYKYSRNHNYSRTPNYYLVYSCTKPKTLSKITGYHYSISIKGLKLSSLSRARESLEKGIAKEINFSYSGLPNLLNELGWRENTAVILMRDLSFHTVVVILADSIILAIVK